MDSETQNKQSEIAASRAMVTDVFGRYGIPEVKTPSTLADYRRIQSVIKLNITNIVNDSMKARFPQMDRKQLKLFSISPSGRYVIYAVGYLIFDSFCKYAANFPDIDEPSIDDIIKFLDTGDCRSMMLKWIVHTFNEVNMDEDIICDCDEDDDPRILSMNPIISDIGVVYPPEQLVSVLKAKIVFLNVLAVLKNKILQGFVIAPCVRAFKDRDIVYTMALANQNVSSINPDMWMILCEIATAADHKRRNLVR